MGAALIQIGIFVGLIALGYGIGSMRERRHLADLDRREAETATILVVDIKSVPAMRDATGGTLVMGEAVIAADYFKTVVAWLRSLIGGEVKTYQTMLSRARRESRLRMIEEARRLGSDTVVNIRFEWSDVGPNIPSAEIFCFGTAITHG